jgi:hypothetical protein
LGCGSRTFLGDDDENVIPGDDGGPTGDAPIVGMDGPIVTTDGPIIGPNDGAPVPDATFFDSPIIVLDGTASFDAIGTTDIFVPPPPPPFDGGEDGPIIVVDAFPPPDDAGFPDSTFPSDAGSEGGSPVFCGGEFCGSDQDCCVTFTGGSTSASCVSGGSCDMGLSLACTGADNCAAGEVCCGSFGGFGAGSTCEPECSPGSIQLCTGDGECPAGEKCRTLPIGLSVCRH